MQPFQSPTLRLAESSPDTAVLWLDLADRPVNVVNAQFLTDLDAVCQRLADQPGIKLLVIRSAKDSGFLAGADLHEFSAIRTGEEAAALSEKGQRLFDRLAGLPQISVAVVHGSCLGGGLELALACDYRLVVDQPKTQLGLPEIELGLLPAWGGTQRLPRVIGLESALRVILGRKRLDARAALRCGLADALATEQTLPAELERLLQRARREGKRPKHGLPRRTWRQKLVESNPLGRWLICRGSRRLLRERVPDDMPAPWEALEAVRVGLAQGMAAGLAYERAAVGRLATTPACRNLIGLFFLREQARKLPAELRAPPQPIRKVGVVGAGTMGAGIAQLAALKGCAVVVQEVNDAALAAGMHKIEDLFQKAVEHRLLSAEEARLKLASVGRTTTWQGFGDADLVVEAVIEELEAKRAVFRELEQQTQPATLLATNTSSLLVQRIQEGLEHPERIGGLHFFNPVHKMPLVEVVRAPGTLESAVATLAQFTIDLGKVPVLVKDSPGFLVNRILMPYLNEAVLRFAQGTRIDQVDEAMRRFGMPMGPLELLDQVGLDVAAHVARTLRPLLEGRHVPHPVFEEMTRRCWLGQKSGVGFYRYSGKTKKPNPDALTLLPEKEAAEWLGGPLTKVQREQAAQELALLMVNEAAACLHEGIAADAQTIDLAMVFGTGWAPHRGGPLRYADERGLNPIVGVLTELARIHGPRFEPCAELRRRAEAGESFYPRH